MRTEIMGTSRLSLCTASAEDFIPLFTSVLADPDVMKYVLAGVPLSLDAARTFFSEGFDHTACGKGLGVIVERSSDEVIGFAGLVPCKVLGEDDFELGFVLAKRAWAKGFAQEIGSAQLAFGFTKLGCSRLLAQVSPHNSASVAALLKIGMHLHTTLESPGRGRRHVFMKQRMCAS